MGTEKTQEVTPKKNAQEHAPASENTQQKASFISSHAKYGFAGSFFITVSAGGTLISNLVDWEKPGILPTHFSQTFDLCAVAAFLIILAMVVKTAFYRCTSEEAEERKFGTGVTFGFACGVLALAIGTLFGVSDLSSAGASISL